MGSSYFLDPRLRDCVCSILLHYIIYINKFLVSFLFSYDLLLVLITKAFNLVLLLLKSDSHFSSSCQK